MSVVSAATRIWVINRLRAAAASQKQCNTQPGNEKAIGTFFFFFCNFFGFCKRCCPASCCCAHRKCMLQVELGVVDMSALCCFSSPISLRINTRLIQHLQHLGEEGLNEVLQHQREQILHVCVNTMLRLRALQPPAKLPLPADLLHGIC